MNAVAKEAVKPFEKLYNFRDMGGLQTEDGRTMKAGVFFRSDDLSRLSGADLAKLQQLNLQVICDLRTPNERKSKPDRIPQNQGIRLMHIPINHASQDFTRMDFFKFLVGKGNGLDFEQIIRDFYQNMAYERTGEIKEIITLLADNRNWPALVHCTGGKDRTGYISALIQLLVGVPYQTVMDNYLYSNDLIQPRMKKIERTIRWMSLFQVSPERLKPLLEVRREYLDEIIQDILKKHGTIEEYLCKACGIEQSALRNLKEMLVE